MKSKEKEPKQTLKGVSQKAVREKGKLTRKIKEVSAEAKCHGGNRSPVVFYNSFMFLLTKKKKLRLFDSLNKTRIIQVSQKVVFMAGLFNWMSLNCAGVPAIVSTCSTQFSICGALFCRVWTNTLTDSFPVRLHMQQKTCT